jgi:hypothetical protein
MNNTDTFLSERAVLITTAYLLTDTEKIEFSKIKSVRIEQVPRPLLPG